MRHLIKWIPLVCCCAWLTMVAHAFAEPARIVIKGLFAGRAMLEVNGQAHLLKEGKTSPEGVTLLQATSQFAQIEYQGEIKKLGLNRQVGANYESSEPAEISIPRSSNGHFISPGRINNRFVEFMIDTGATSITLNSFTADQLGIAYKDAPTVMVETASGNIDGHQVILQSVAIGDLRLTNVSALVLEGRFPQTILLGNSFLGRVNMQMDSVAMTLQAKY